MGALTKADLAEMLFDELGLNKREAKEIVEMFYSEICASSGEQRPGKAVWFWQLRAARQKQPTGAQPENR